MYEVHRLTRTVDDARDILQQGRVAFGVGLYMMGMLGVLLLIAELLFQPQIYFEPNLWIIGLFVLIPILISPWETMNAQLAGKGDTRIGATTIGTGIRRILTRRFGHRYVDHDYLRNESKQWRRNACLACRNNAGLHGSNDPRLWANHGCVLEHALIE